MHADYLSQIILVVLNSFVMKILLRIGVVVFFIFIIDACFILKGKKVIGTQQSFSTNFRKEGLVKEDSSLIIVLIPDSQREKDHLDLIEFQLQYYNCACKFGVIIEPIFKYKLFGIYAIDDSGIHKSCKHVLFKYPSQVRYIKNRNCTDIEIHLSELGLFFKALDNNEYSISPNKKKQIVNRLVNIIEKYNKRLKSTRF